MEYFVLIPIIAFLSEFIDSSLGGGYGTILSPVLCLMGYDPKIVVPSVLISELFTGIAAGIGHSSVGNLRFSDPNVKKTCFWMCGLSAIGALFSAIFALKVSSAFIGWFIAGIVILMGLSGVFGFVEKLTFSLKRILALGMLASFNKAVSGGGYGPIVTMGQLVGGIDAKSAIAITSLSEGIVCLIASAVFIYKGKPLDFNLVMMISFAALLSVPFAVWAVKKIPEKLSKRLVSVVMMILGVLLVLKLIGG